VYSASRLEDGVPVALKMMKTKSDRTTREIECLKVMKNPHLLHFDMFFVAEINRTAACSAIDRHL
jgi:hypothetical protein